MNRETTVVAIALLVIYPMLSGCAGTYIKEDDQRFANLPKEMESLNLEDGVNFEEAVILSRNYLQNFLRISKRVEDFSTPQEEFRRWKITVTGHLDYVPLSSKQYNLYISKISGFTFWNQGPKTFYDLRFRELKYRIDEQLTEAFVQTTCTKRKTVPVETANKECNDLAVELQAFVTKKLQQYIFPDPLGRIEIKPSVPRVEPWSSPQWADYYYWSVSIPFKYRD